MDENTLALPNKQEPMDTEQQEEHAPVLRVWLFEGGRLEWHVAPIYQEEPWKGRAAARAIFFLLLCAPNRQALRGHLTGILWPEMEEENARSCLRSALKVLAEDRLREWITHRWIKARRQRVQVARRRLIRSLADLYVQRGEHVRAEELLQEHIITFPSDQDALYRLMKLLIKAECFVEAREAYERGKAALTSLGKHPAEPLKALAEHLVTLPQTLLPIRSQTSERPSATTGSSTLFAPISLLTTFQQDEISSHFADTVAQKIIGAIYQLEGENNQTMNPVRRTTTIAGLLGLTQIATQISFDAEPWERLIRASNKTATMNAEAFYYFQQLLECGWGLSNAGELNLAEQLLSSFLLKMIQLAPHQQQAASLAAEGMRLEGILAAHQLKLSDKLVFSLQAVEYAQKADDPNILVAELTELAVAFEYTQQLESAFKTYQRALSLANTASPLIRSRTYGRSAVAFARKGYKQEAFSYLRLAYNNMPEHPEHEPNFLSSDHGPYKLAHHKGLMYLFMDEPLEAANAFESFREHPSSVIPPERSRLEIINDQGKAAIKLNDLRKYADCLEQGMVGAIRLRSKKRFDEALTIYQQEMPREWRHEEPIKDIVERFHL